jgi:hypothetical protein
MSKISLYYTKHSTLLVGIAMWLGQEEHCSSGREKHNSYSRKKHNRSSGKKLIDIAGKTIV